MAGGKPSHRCRVQEHGAGDEEAGIQVHRAGDEGVGHTEFIDNALVTFYCAGLVWS